MQSYDELQVLEKEIRDKLYELRIKAGEHRKQTDLLSLVIRLFNEYDPDERLDEEQVVRTVRENLKDLYEGINYRKGMEA